ncbi:MAG TPA: 3'(2'),5'-bisphosphate nucleotidase CysQ [Caulobacteraceae bacterium]|jgi:3'(2'), 5'-bisphosphate nucleotidase|nr:3'(2'),5'-bisphosphate nucleotidase CysQ [Caulobacteraceae bacterium]
MKDFADPGARSVLMEGMVVAALEAGAAIWKIFQEDFEVLQKSDTSPVTAADTAAEAIILRALAHLAPSTPVVAEEEFAAGRIPDVDHRFFLVDPLDGTKEFVRRGTDFTVNIALVEARSPTMGVVYAPARARLYAGDAALGSAWTADAEPGARPPVSRRPLAVRPLGKVLTAVASKSHDTPETEAYLKACKVAERVSIGSSLKFCLLADGEADLYPRPAPTCEWDTAAGHAVLAAAGGRVFGPDGLPLAYGKPRFFNPGFVATAVFDPPPLAPFMPAGAR